MKIPRTRFLRTLYGKIAAVFVVLLSLQVVFQSYLLIRNWRELGLSSEQLVDWDFAESLKPVLQPLVDETIDYEALQRALFEIETMRPKIAIYLIDTSGKVRGHVGRKQSLRAAPIDVAPLKSFERGPEQHLPLFGQDPIVNRDDVIFSAAPIRIGHEPGYIYVVLAGKKRRHAITTLESEGGVRVVLEVIGFSVLITLLAGLLAFSLITRRLRRLTSGITAFQAGDYRQRIPVTARDELGDLSTAFNRMAETIEANIAELERNDMMRRQLVANISHDLRGPITSITGFLELIEMDEGKTTEDTLQTFHEIVFRNATLLNRLIHELFELSTLDARDTPLSVSEFSLSELAADTARRYQPLARQRGVDLLAETPAETLHVTGDPFLLARALANLVENALRFTPEGGSVKIAIAKKADACTVSVADTGIGIAEENLNHIFDEYYQADLRKQGKKEGAGLGLTIAQKIIQAHGSAISVQSRLSHGTTFSFALERDASRRRGEHV